MCAVLSASRESSRDSSTALGMTINKSSVMSWSKRDWFFCLILAVITILAYQPAWHGARLARRTLMG